MILAAILLAAGGPRVEVEAGFGGTAFPFGWIRVTALVSNDGPPRDADLELTLRGAGILPVRHRARISLPTPSRKRYVWDVFVGRLEEEVQAALVDGTGTVIASALAPLRLLADEERRVLVAGRVPVSLAEAEPLLGSALVRVSPERVPGDLLPLQAAEIVVFPDTPRLEPEQERALLQWVSGGGKLIFFAGSSFNPGDGGFWDRLCPLEEARRETVSIRDVTVPLVTGRGASMLAAAGRLLGARARRGAGEVLFVGYPADLPGMEKAVAPADLWRELLSVPPPPEEKLDPRGRRILVRTPSTYLRPVDQQLHGLAPNAPMPDLVAVLTGIAGMLVYVLLIGPLGYLRLRKRGRLRAGALLLATAIPAFSGLAWYWSRHLSLRTPRVAQVVLVEEGQARAFAVLRAGTAGLHEMSGAGAVSPIPFYSTWGWRSEAEPPVVEGGTLRLEVPVLSSLLATSFRVRDAAGGRVSCRWLDREAGRIEISSTLEVPLKDGRIFAGGRVHALGPVEPGSVRQVALTRERSIDFADWARGPGWTRSNSAEVWTERARLAERLVFYGALRALGQTLPDREILRPPGIDWSPRLAAGQAVFLGRLESDPGGLEFSPRAQVETIGLYRAVVEGP